MFNIAVLISGSGSNLKSIIDKSKENKKYKVRVVIADRKCDGIKKALKENIETAVIDRKIYKENLFKEINEILSDKNIDLIVLAGFLSIVDEKFIKKWENKIINIHPSLLPKFGGKGMYGIHVHEEVIKSKEKISGCSVHYVNNEIDGGKIIMQKEVLVYETDTAEILQKRVLIVEHKLLPNAIIKIIESINS